MHSLRARGPIRPKISTMPRPKTEASMQLELYKLATEKQRIHHELRLLELRRHQLQERLSAVSSQMADVEKKILDLREENPEALIKETSQTVAQPQQNLATFYLEY